METVSCFGGHEEDMQLPPGFRFHPTDEELITHYLSPKVLDCSFCATAIGEVDLNKVEPWDLPWKAKFGEKEWYFFCLRDRKYPTGQRTNRATDAGYWKATGKDRDIFKSKTLVGMKKTLVFYKGRAPKGEKTNWVMHEFRLEGKYSMHNLPKTAKNEWVICRVFNKSLGGKKMHISGLIRSNNMSSNLPPLMDISLHDSSITITTTSSVFSDSMEEHKPHHPLSCPTPIKNSVFTPVSMPYIENFQYADSGLIQDQSIQRHYLIENSELETKQNYELGMRNYDDYEFSINSAGPVDLDCLWSY